MAETTETPEMMFEMGKRFYLPKAGEPDPLLALQYFTKSAEAGYVPAQRVLGTYYLEGRLTAADYTLAHKWLSAAARQNDGQAAYQLAYMYIRGQGVTKDWSVAFRLLDMECARSLADAQVLKEELKEQLADRFPDIRRRLAELEASRRRHYSSHRLRFIQPWDTPRRPQSAKEEFDVWFRLNQGAISPEQGLAELSALQDAYCAEQETLYP
jgi:hypothetical protein